jgi:crossover junction endodeoxyribonuclease RuvC
VARRRLVASLTGNSAGLSTDEAGWLVGRRRRGYQRCIVARPIRILGIDPGLRRTGWGVVEIEGNRLGFCACGSLATDDKATLAMRLLAIHDGLRRVVEEAAPDEAAVEATFVSRDAAATLKLGQARGIARLVPAIAGLPVAEYAPNLIKKTIIGTGHGEKAQIRMMIGVLLPKADPQSHDAADALAIAICHAHHRQSVVLRVAAQ